MNDQTGTNGHSSLRLSIQPETPEFLKKKRYHVVVQTSSGFQNLTQTPVEDPIELLRMEVNKNHVVGFSDVEALIVDAETAEVIEKFESYAPEPQGADEPITPHNAEIRDRWIGNMFKWLLPSELLALDDTPESQAKVLEFLTSIGVTFSQSPGGTQVVFMRDGTVLAGWRAWR